jgi:hypothetical protein
MVIGIDGDRDRCLSSDLIAADLWETTASNNDYYNEYHFQRQRRLLLPEVHYDCPPLSND